VPRQSARAPSPECQRLLKEIQAKCGDIVRPTGLEPGSVLDPVAVREDELAGHLSVVLAPARGQPRVVWNAGDAELLLHADLTRAFVHHGLVLIGLVVEARERGEPVTLTVPFAVGDSKTSAGNVVTAERKARGDPRLVERWGPPAVAAAYKGLIDAANAVAANQGYDLDGAPLVCGELAGVPNRLLVTPQARHESDRVRSS
jgi:hypothetical protein